MMADNKPVISRTAVSGTVAKPQETKGLADVAEEEATDDLKDAEAASENIDDFAFDDSKLVDTGLDDVTIEAVSGDTQYPLAKRFEDLNLSADLLRGLYVEMKFEKPSKMQASSLPMILTPPHRNLIAQAHNGSGKTTCFVIGMLSRIDPMLIAPQALCICPTRELANQNMEVLLKIGKFSHITSELAIPPDSAAYNPVKRSPSITAQIIIGTPGTVCKLMQLRKLNLSQMKILVFDEADQILAEDAFLDDSRRVMRKIAKSSSICQVLLFSATFNDAVRNFVTMGIDKMFVGGSNQLFVKKEELMLE